MKTVSLDEINIPYLIIDHDSTLRLRTNPDVCSYNRYYPDIQNYNTYSCKKDGKVLTCKGELIPLEYFDSSSDESRLILKFPDFSNISIKKLESDKKYLCQLLKTLKTLLPKEVIGYTVNLSDYHMQYDGWLTLRFTSFEPVATKEGLYHRFKSISVAEFDAVLVYPFKQDCNEERFFRSVQELRRFKHLTDDELYMLYRSTIESSFVITIGEYGGYTDAQKTIHSNLLNELLLERKVRDYPENLTGK